MRTRFRFRYVYATLRFNVRARLREKENAAAPGCDCDVASPIIGNYNKSRASPFPFFREAEDGVLGTDGRRRLGLDLPIDELLLGHRARAHGCRLESAAPSFPPSRREGKRRRRRLIRPPPLSHPSIRRGRAEHISIGDFYCVALLVATVSRTHIRVLRM